MNELFRMRYRQVVRMILIAVSLISFQSYAQELYLIKSGQAPNMCLQDVATGNLLLQPCDPQNEKQRWDILKGTGGIFTAGATYGKGVYIESLEAPYLVIQSSQQRNLCLGLFQEKTSAGTPVPFQECKDWLGSPKLHNRWKAEKVNLPSPIPPGEAVSAGNFICLGHNYQSQFADKASLEQIETTGGELRGAKPATGYDSRFIRTARFCTNPQELMSGDLVFVKIPANTIPCQGSQPCESFATANKAFLKLYASSRVQNVVAPLIQVSESQWPEFFIQENGKFKAIERRTVPNYLGRDLFTLFQVTASVVQPDVMNPGRIIDIYATAENHRPQARHTHFALGTTRLVEFSPLSPMSASQVTAQCGTTNIKGTMGQGVDGGTDLSARFKANTYCSNKDTFYLRSSPFVRQRVVKETSSKFEYGFAICRGDAFKDAIKSFENIIAEPNTHTLKIARSQKGNKLLQGILGDGLHWRAPNHERPCKLFKSYPLPDGSFECRDQWGSPGCKFESLWEGSNFIWAYQLYDYSGTGVPTSPDAIVNYHYMQLLGAFLYDPQKTQPSPTPAPPPLNPIQPPSPPPAAAPQPTPSTKQTNLSSKGRRTELGVRQSYLRPNYGNLIPNPRGLGGWQKDVGAGLQNHAWDVPAAIHWRKIDQNALFHNDPDRNHYYPDGFIPVINPEAELTYRISHVDIGQQIIERGYSISENADIWNQLKPGHQQCELNIVSYTNGTPSNPTKYTLEQNKGEEFINKGTVDYYFEGALSASVMEKFFNQTITGAQARQGIEFGARVECQIPGIKKGNVTENFRYHTKQRNFIWQRDHPVYFLSSKNEGLENSSFKLDWQFSTAFDSRGRWGSNGGLMVPFSRVPPYAANPWQAELNKLTLCPNNKCALMNIYFAPDIGGGAVFNRLKRSLPMNQEFYSMSNKSINEVLNTTELNFNIGFFFTYELNYGAGDVLPYPEGKNTDTVPRSFGPVWAAPNSQRAKNYLRKLRPNVDPKILESRWLERQQYLRSKDFDNQSISRTLAYCQVDPAFPDRFGYARYGFPLDPNGVLNDLAQDPNGKCAWLDIPTASETPKVDPPKTPPPAETCNQNLAPTCSTNPRFSKMRFGAYYFRDSASSARPEPFNIYLKENATYVIGEREDQPKFSGNYFICDDKIHFQNLAKVGTFEKNNLLRMDSFLPNLAGVPKAFLCTGNACRSEGEVPTAAKLCQAAFKKVDPPPAVKNPDDIKGVQEEKQTELKKGEIIKLPQSAEDVKAIPKLQPIAPPEVDEPLRPIAPPRMVPTPDPSPPVVESKPVPVAKPEPAPPPVKPAAPPVKKEPEFSVPIAR